MSKKEKHLNVIHVAFSIQQILDIPATKITYSSSLASISRRALYVIH